MASPNRALSRRNQISQHSTGEKVSLERKKISSCDIKCAIGFHGGVFLNEKDEFASSMFKRFRLIKLLASPAFVLMVNEARSQSS